MPGPNEVWSIVLSFLSTRPARLAAQGAVLATVVGATLAFASTGTATHLLTDDQGDGDSTRAVLAEAPDELTMDIAPPKHVTVTADGSTLSVSTTARTVSELLAQQNVTLGAQDQLNVAASAPLAPGMEVSVVRVTSREVTKIEKVPFSTTRKKTSTLTVGTTKVLTKGVSGTKKLTYTLTYADGRQIAGKRTAVVVTKAPVNAVIQVGTKPKTTASTSSGSGSSGSGSSGSGSSGSSVGSSVDNLNWAALAKCESGGNPKAVNSAGYYGLYQFSLSTWRSVGGSGNPANASSSEQTLRAKILYKKAGAGQWPVCGRKLFT